MSSEQEKFSDALTGILESMEVICRQLIERGLIDKELLIADLDERQIALASREGLGKFGPGMPAVLVGILRREAA